MRRLLLAGVLCGGLSGTPQLAHAAELAARGPGECADAAELSFRVEHSIGMPLGQAAPLNFDVEMASTTAGYSAKIHVSTSAPGNRAQERVLAAADCTQLADAVAVAIALALGVGDDPAATAGPESAGSEPPVASPPAPPPSASAQDSTAAESPAPSAAWLPSLSLWMLGDAGSLPAPSLGAALGAELAGPRFQLRLLGTLLFEQETQIESALTPAPGAKLELLTGSLLACTAPFGALRAPFAAVVCLGMELGRLAGEGTNVPSPRRGSALWAAPRAELGAFWTLGDSLLRLGVTLTAAVPLNRDVFALPGLGTVHQPPSVVGRLGLGIELGFD